MKRRSRKKTGNFKGYFATFGFLVVLLAALVLLQSALHVATSAYEQLESLPVPDIHIIKSPEPLVLATESSSVLGFGTFDPFEVIDAVNTERSQNGAKPLRANETLMKAAELRARTILDHENFSHQDPYAGIELGTVLPKLNYHFVFASENIGMGGNSGHEFVTGFMNSTSHRINLLNPELTDTGVAVADGPYGRYYVNIVVQIFSIPGGLDEYRGYSQPDRAFYETQLTALSTKLEPLTWWILTITDGNTYSEDRKKTFLTQQEILTEVVTVMQQDKPLENRHVALIRDYNRLLSGR